MPTAPMEPKRGMAIPGYLERLRGSLPHPVIQGMKAPIRRYGAATASSRPLPDYLIVGTKKGGTTSLINWLVAHPHVCRMFPPPQRLKSAHYFDINYARGLSWYRSHFPSETVRNRLERSGGHPVVVGEASPYYMFHPAVPYRVAETLPDVKIIVLLRDPVSRAYSNYWDRRATQTEDIQTFEAAIDAEAERLATVDEYRLLHDPSYYSFDHDNHSYLARGRYLEHLQPWIDMFRPEQLLILRAEAMFTEPERVFTRVQSFLDIPVVGTIPLSKFNERSRPPMAAETRARLADYYRPHNAALYKALGEDFGWEAKYPS